MWSLFQKALLLIVTIPFFLPMAFADAGEGTEQADTKTTMKAELKEELRKELREELKEEIKAELKEELRRELRGELRGELRAQLKDELIREITGEIIAKLTDAGIDLAYVEPGFDLEAEKKLKITKLPQTATEYDEVLTKVEEKLRQAKAKPVKLPPSKQEFIVREIQVRGNSLVSTDELFKELPIVYTVSEQKDGTVSEDYNFETLHGIIFNPGSGRTVSLKAIQGLTKYILSIYQAKGYAGIYVYVPMKAVGGEGQLEKGVLQIQVLEAKVGEITVTSYDFDRQKRKKEILKKSVIKSWSPVKVGDVVEEKKLDDFVRLLNLNPDRYVSPIISQSDDPNALNLGYNVYEGNPWHWYVQVDNSGTDKRQWAPRFGMVNTNLMGRDDRLSLMYQVRPDSMEEMKSNYSLYANYEFPFLSPRLRLGVYGGYTKFDITPDMDAGINFRGNGSVIGGTLRYNMFQKGDWFFDILGSLSTERSKITPSLGIKTSIDMDLLGIGFEIHRSGEKSSTSIGFNRTQSIGGSDKKDFQIARWKSDPAFTIYTISAFHKRFLDKFKVHELSVSLRDIIPTARLAPSKMTAFGGLYTVRGYEESAIVADGGMISSLQYRFDWTRYKEKGKEIDGKKSNYGENEKLWPPRISLLAFSDYGRTKVKNRVPGERGDQDLWSIGTGSLVDVGKNMDIGVYYSWPLLNTEDTEKNDGKLNLSLIYRW